VDLTASLGLGNVHRLTRGEWGLLRSAFGAPRRLSLRFLKEERIKLEAYRQAHVLPLSSCRWLYPRVEARWVGGRECCVARRYYWLSNRCSRSAGIISMMQGARVYSASTRGAHAVAVHVCTASSCREHVRRKYEEVGLGADVPPELPRPLRVGQEVVASHPVTRQLHDGLILTIKKDNYR
jgi:hypothetical protein